MRALPLLVALLGCTESDPCGPDSAPQDSEGGQDSPGDSRAADDSGSPDDSADSGGGDDTQDSGGDSADCTPDDSGADDSGADDSGDSGDSLSWPEGPTVLVWTRIQYDYNGITTEFSDLRVRVGEDVDCDVEQAVYTARLDASGGACHELLAEANARVDAGAPGPVVDLALSFGDDDGDYIVPESGSHSWPDTDRVAPHVVAYGLRADWAALVDELDCSESDPFSSLESWQNVNAASATVRVSASSEDSRTLSVQAQLDGLGALSLDPTQVTVCPINLFE